MCGIFGILNTTSQVIFRKPDFIDALKLMSHRGPDAEGIWSLGNKVILGHRRLSIIDLQPESNQPFILNDRYIITYNGEIYNYIELRNELIKYGFTFKTKSDTEVLLRAYEFWGEKCVNKFNGMWAFAIYDSNENKLFCSRDRFGVKPFNYAISSGQFVFSSEIKSILSYFPQFKVPNYNAIANFCRTSAGAQHEETWFNGVFRLQPAHNMVITNGEFKKYRYWEYPTKYDKSYAFEEAKIKHGELFEDALSLRMRSDVPVGTTLSSGVDSNSIVYTLRKFYSGKHHTFTADFRSKEFDKLEKKSFANKNIIIDEAKIVEQTIKEAQLIGHIIHTDYSNFVEDLQQIIYHLESGNSSPAVFPLMQVMKRAKKYVTVILEGQGADELLAGYQQSLLIASTLDDIRSIKLKNALISTIQNAKTYSLQYAFMLYLRALSNKYDFISRLYQKYSEIDKIYTKKLSIKTKLNDCPLNLHSFNDNINKILAEQHSGGLVNLLHYGDAISMAHSLESRLPFMDYRLVENAFRMPRHYKLRMQYGKYIHRQAMVGIVPETILNEPAKIGFSTPISQFFKFDNPLKVKPKEILLSDISLSRGLFNKTALNNLFEEHNKNIKNHSPLLFRLLCVELWFREFIDK